MDLQQLLADLGPVSSALGLDASSPDAVARGDVPRSSVELFAWARWILQGFGTAFLLPGGPLEVLVPGLELLKREPDSGNLLLRLDLQAGFHDSHNSFSLCLLCLL